MSKLTLHQEIKLLEIELLLGARNKRIVLKGSAGVGKTFLVNSLIRKLKDSRKHCNIIVSAPTHKALAVLRGKITEDVDFSTIHSTLQYKYSTNNETGAREFKSSPSARYPPLKRVQYLIIDEASMLPLEMLFTIEEHANREYTTVIFIGDDKQLNPVKENESCVFKGCPTLFETSEEAKDYSTRFDVTNAYIPAFQKQYVGFKPYSTVELTEIIRQGKGNPIIELSRNISSIYRSKNDSLINPDTGYLYSGNYPKIIAELALVNGTDDLKYLAWTNEEVDKINKVVRHQIYGENPAKIEKGETIVFNAPYAKKKEVLYQTNEEITVETLRVATMKYSIKFLTKEEEQCTEYKVYIINDTVEVIHEDSMQQYREDVAKMQMNCSRYLLGFAYKNDFIDKFADFKYNHAITVHKSQGSTYRRVILNVGDISKNFNTVEKQRLLYTGITRTSELLILYNV